MTQITPHNHEYARAHREREKQSTGRPSYFRQWVDTRKEAARCIASGFRKKYHTTHRVLLPLLVIH